MTPYAPGDQDVTRFGASWCPLSRAAAVLRARGAALGIELGMASPIDLAGACAAVELWLETTKVATLEHAAGTSAEARVALALALRRAAGAHTGVDGELLTRVTDGGVADDPDLLASTYRLAGWCERLGLDAPAVLRRAATDLARGGARLARVGALAATLADQLEPQ